MAFAVVLAFAGCGRRDETPAACVPGAVVTCPCAGAPVGSQTCQPSGTFGACACPTAAPAPLVDPDKPPPVVPSPEAPASVQAAGTRRASAPRVAQNGRLDDLMNSVARPTGGDTPELAAAADLPEMPRRPDVAGAMRGVGSAVRSCGTGSGGTATVTVVFNSQGRVTTANVSPPFAGTPVGNCIAHGRPSRSPSPLPSTDRRTWLTPSGVRRDHHLSGVHCDAFTR